MFFFFKIFLNFYIIYYECNVNILLIYEMYHFDLFVDWILEVTQKV